MQQLSRYRRRMILRYHPRAPLILNTLTCSGTASLFIKEPTTARVIWVDWRHYHLLHLQTSQSRPLLLQLCCQLSRVFHHPELWIPQPTFVFSLVSVSVVLSAGAVGRGFINSCGFGLLSIALQAIDSALSVLTIELFLIKILLAYMQ